MNKQAKKNKPEVEAFQNFSRSLGQIPKDRLLNMRQNILKAVAENQENQTQTNAKSWNIFNFFALNQTSIFRFSLAAFFGLCLIGGTAVASEKAKPGDLLYPIKLAKETIILNLAVTKISRVSLQADFARERIKELKALPQAKNDEPKKNKSNHPEENIDNNIATTIPASSTTTSSTVPIISIPKKNNSSLKQKAKKEAEEQVSNALKSMTDIQREFNNKGDSKAADQMGQNIIQLETEAKNNNLEITSPKHENTQGKVKGAESTQKDEKQNPELKENNKDIPRLPENKKSDQEDQKKDD